MRNRAFKFTLVFAGASLLLICLVAFVQRQAIKISNRNLPYVKLSDGLGAQISQADFWIAQVKKSDPNLNFERAVLEPLSNSKLLLESMYEGKETEFGSFEKPDDESKAVLKESIFNVDQLL